MTQALASPGTSRDVTRDLLDSITGRRRAVVSATVAGRVAGLGLLDTHRPAAPAGRWTSVVAEGAWLQPGEPIVEITGSAGEVAVAEDHVLGPLGLASGIAMAAAPLREACPPGLRLSCGGWKKLPAALKPLLRAGLAVAGVTPRLVPGDFVYVPKTSVRMLGGPVAATAAAAALDHGPVSIQVTSVDEAIAVARAGAGIVMVDDGRLDTLRAVHQALGERGLRDALMVAFAGGVTADDLLPARTAGADIVDIGRAILDAPLWDLHVDVVE